MLKNTYLDIIEKTTLTSIDLLFIYNNKLLLGLRNNEPAKNFWFTIGSRTYKNEKLKEGIKRIVKNECGIEDIKNPIFLGVYSHIYTNNFSNNNFGTHYVNSAYIIKLDKLPKIKLDDQHTKYKWVELENIENEKNIHEFVKILLEIFYQKTI